MNQNQNQNQTHDEPSVSILTITQYSRRKCLTNLAQLIKSQLYKNITEWVIVDGSNHSADAIANEKYIISQWKTLTLMPFNLEIVYIPFKPQQHLSDLRNTGNNSCHGDIIVCMDDDDYYPPTRVSHAVYRLVNSSALIAGCSNAYIYFYLYNRLFQFRTFGPNHSTNNCMAYKREYLKNHSHASGLDKAEESSFTNGFTEPMVQLDAGKCIVISCHTKNTVDKDWICSDEKSKKIAIELNAASYILDFIPLPILLNMEKMFEEMIM